MHGYVNSDLWISFGEWHFLLTINIHVNKTFVHALITKEQSKRPNGNWLQKALFNLWLIKETVERFKSYRGG